MRGLFLDSGRLTFRADLPAVRENGRAGGAALEDVGNVRDRSGLDRRLVDLRDRVTDLAAPRGARSSRHDHTFETDRLGAQSRQELAFDLDRRRPVGPTFLGARQLQSDVDDLLEQGCLRF